MTSRAKGERRRAKVEDKVRVEKGQEREEGIKRGPSPRWVAV